MNPLFLGLVIAGVVLVVGVLLYNWIQERRLRRRGPRAGRSGAGHVARDAGHGRAEPVLGPRVEAERSPTGESVSVARDDEPLDAAAQDTDVPAVDEAPLPRRLTARSREDLAPDPDIECVVWLTLAQPAATAALGHALTARCAKPLRWLGRSGGDARWRTIDGANPGPWNEIASCMLLANRSGAASRDDLEAFLRLVDGVAASVGAECVWPDEREEAERAEALDRLCADLDVQIGLTLLKGEPGQLAGTRLRGVAEAAGFRLSSAGEFEYAQEDTGALLYSLQNLRGQPFTLENLRASTVAGVVLLLDVPRVPEPVKAFDQMRLLAKRLAQTLEAALVDDNRRPLDDAALGDIRAQVYATAVALREAHVDPGGQRALRLFG
ncbi:MAG TPA: cell division protein ZipA C-terminal FtsZ-binding domain-containing protein [Casimicrobiaceae bacterium]